MAVIPKPYGLMLQSLWEGRISLTLDPLMCMLVGDAYIPNQNTHKFRSIVIDEIVASGYASGGKEVTGVTLDYDSGTKKLVIDGGPLVWPTLTMQDANYAVLYVGANVPVTAQPLIAYIDFGELIDRDDEPLYINWPSSGILSQTVP